MARQLKQKTPVLLRDSDSKKKEVKKDIIIHLISVSEFYTHQDADVHTLTKNKGAHTKKRKKRERKILLCIKSFFEVIKRCKDVRKYFQIYI